MRPCSTTPTPRWFIGLTEAIQSFEEDVRAALHDLPASDPEQIESYSYVELNLEAAHERLNTIFMFVAIFGYLESSDQVLTLHVMYVQLLPQTRNYLNQKKDAIASMATAHPGNEVFAAYSTRANALLGEQADSLVDELYRRIGAYQH